MKVRFFTVLTILILVCAGFYIYLSVNKDKFSLEKSIPTITASPSQAVTPLPTVTPVPLDNESAPGAYPAYQSANGTDVFGYINQNGEFSIKPAFDIAGDFHDGVAVVQMSDQYLAIDTKGSILYYSKYPIQDFHNGAAVISREMGDTTLYGYIDTEGKEIVKPIYHLAGDFGTDDTAFVYSGQGKYAQIDKTGRVLKSFELNKKYSPRVIADGYVIYYNSKKDLYGVINLMGEKLFPGGYVEILYMGNDIFALKKAAEEYYGMYTELPYALYHANGEQITDFNLFDVTPFFNGYASATDNTNTFFIDQNGKEVTTLPKFEGRGTVKLFEDLVKAKIDDDLIYSNTDGTIIWHNATSQTLSGNVCVQTKKFKTCRYVLVYYPQLEGLTDSTVQEKINSKLKQLFTASRTGITEKDKYIVEDTFRATLIKNLLIIERDGYDYSFGAAHGDPIMDYYYIDITTGTFYQLKDLFIQGSDYVNAINNAVSADIASSSDEDSMYFENSFTGIKDNQTFIITPDKITIYFYPYEIAAYAAGFPQFDIPMDNLYDYIDFNSAFWQSFH